MLIVAIELLQKLSATLALRHSMEVYRGGGAGVLTFNFLCGAGVDVFRNDPTIPAYNIFGAIAGFILRKI